MYKKQCKKKKSQNNFLRIFQISYKTTHAAYNSFIDPESRHCKKKSFFFFCFKFLIYQLYFSPEENSIAFFFNNSNFQFQSNNKKKKYYHTVCQNDVIILSDFSMLWYRFILFSE